MKTNDNNTKWVGTNLLCALGASLCCLAPVFAVLAGIGGVASLFSWRLCPSAQSGIFSLGGRFYFLFRSGFGGKAS